MDQLGEPDLGDSLEVANRIDKACDDFERSWIEGGRPSIESAVDVHASGIRQALFAQLLTLELELRRSVGEHPTDDEYLDRFPEHRDVILRHFSEFRREEGSRGTRSYGGPTSDTLQEDLDEGHRLRQFRLVSNLGSGTFGTVWRAYDTQLRRYVALKIPNVRRLSVCARASFLEEARAVAALRHPHVVTVHEIAESGPFLFIVAEYVAGGSLRDQLKQGPLATRDAAEIIRQIALGLHHAHEHGIIHRDLKPANILIDSDGRPLIADFGLAIREAASDRQIGAVQGGLAGTPSYMAPEQVAGSTTEIDRRTDIYALGVILYESLTGRPPFQGARAELFRAITEESPRAIRPQNPSVPETLEQICLKCLAKRRDLRFATAHELAQALANTSPDSRVTQSRYGRRTVIGLGAALAAGAALWGAFSPHADANPGQLVAFASEPSGCRVSVARFSDSSGEIDLRSIRMLPGRTPIDEPLLPGDYAVTVIADDGRFHEVRRRVPSNNEHFGTVSLTGGWKRDKEGRIVLKRIVLPSSATIHDMVAIPGQTVTFGDIQCRVPGFLSDRSEVGADVIHELHLHPAGAEVSADGQLLAVTFEAAVDVAERLGKRLPTLAEFKALSQQAAIDGIDSGVAEWTTTKPDWPGVPQLARDAARLSQKASRAICCGKQGPELRPRMERSSVRVAPETSVRLNGFEHGLRGVRSVRPRIRPEDFPSTN